MKEPKYIIPSDRFRLAIYDIDKENGKAYCQVQTISGEPVNRKRWRVIKLSHLADDLFIDDPIYCFYFSTITNKYVGGKLIHTPEGEEIMKDLRIRSSRHE